MSKGKPGRPPLIVEGDDPTVIFARDLQGLRQAAGLTLRQLAQLTRYSTATLSTATSGRRLPSLPIVRAYVKACGGDVGEWERRWQDHGGAAPLPHARVTLPRKGAKSKPVAGRERAPRQQVVRTLDASKVFREDLRTLRLASQKTYGQISHQSGFSVQTLHATCNDRSALPKLEVVQAIVQACGGKLAAWRERWYELNDQLAAEKAVPPVNIRIDTKALLDQLRQEHQINLGGAKVRVTITLELPTAQ
jgi:transcriptional regulator with XRE-family HTH domain